MANELFYPAGIDVLGTYLGSVTDQQVESNIDDLTQYANGDYAPGFVGGSKAAPDFSCPTNDLTGALDLMNVDALCKDVSAGTVRVMYRAGKNRSTREAPNASAHMVYSMVSNGMLYWESIDVSQDEQARIEVRACPLWNGNNAPLAQLPSQTITSPADPSRFFTLGPVVINGTRITRLKSMGWKNGIELDKDSANGDVYPTYGAIGKIKPVISIESTDLAQLAAFNMDGFAVTSLTVYFRRRKANRINEADATAVHCKLTATAGSAKWRRVGGEKATGRLEIALGRPSGGGAIFAYTKDIAIV